jgi:hypothetical protein
MAYVKTQKLQVELNLLVRGTNNSMGEEPDMLNQDQRAELESLITAYVQEQKGLDGTMVEVVS